MITLQGRMIFEDYWFYLLELGSITAAIEIKLFTLLDGKKIATKEIAKELKVHASALEPLLLVLAQMRFLVKEAELYSSSEESRLLLSEKSSFFRGSYFVETRKVGIHDRLIQFLKEGSAPLAEQGKSFSEMWEKGVIDEESASKFTNNMQALMKHPAHLNSNQSEFSECKHIVDVGGGSGAWAVALAQRHPQLHVTIFDLAPVLTVAKKMITREDPSLLSRIHFESGNFFTDPFPKSADAFLLSNILHDWSIQQCERLLFRIRESLPLGGRLFIHECMLDPEKLSPKFSVFFNLLMALNHQSQQFTQGELDRLLVKTGFDPARFLGMNRNYSLLVAQPLAATI